MKTIYFKSVNIFGTKWADKNLVIDGKEHFTFDEAQEIAKSIPGWRLPTIKELAILENAVSVCDNVLKGRWFTECKNDINVKGKEVLFPAAGYRYSSSLYTTGSYGYCWSSSANNAAGGWGLYFYQSYVYQYSLNRLYAFSVRLVRE